MRCRPGPDRCTMNSFNRILYLALAVYVAVLLYKGWTSGQVMTRRRPPGKRYGLVDRGEAPRRYWGYMLFSALALMLFVAMTIWSA